jgi:hypothetical protein
MRPERLKILLVFSALLMFAFTGELAAQAITFGTHPDTIYYNVEIEDLAVLLDTGGGYQAGDTVLFSVISGDGSVSPAFDLTDSYGVAATDFTAGTTDGTVAVEAKWVNPANTDSLVDTTYIEVEPAPTTLTITPTGRSIVTGEDLTLTATLDGVIGGDTINFTVLGNGAVIPSDTVTDASGVTTTTFAAPGSAEVDTVIGTWDDGFNPPVSDTVVINIVDAPDNLYWNVATATLDLEDDQAFTARITLSGAGVGGLMVDFLVSPGLGSVAPESGTTSPTGYVSTTYTASTVAGTDTLIAVWTDEDLRAELTDTLIITINPGPPTSLNVNPLDTVVVVTNDAVIVAELLDDYLNHVTATSTDQVTFTSDGNGGFGDKNIDDAGCITVAYTTDDSMATDTITTQLVGHTTDYTRVRTIGAAPASMHIYAEADSEVVVGGNEEELMCSLFDAYGNPSAWADWYGDETYKVFFTVSTGGGTFDDDSIWVYPDGVGYNDYYSSNIAAVYTITGTSGAATDDVDITQTPDDPDSVVLTPDSIGIPAGTDTTLTATMFDQYGNHVNATNVEEIYWYENGRGYFGSAAYIDDESHDIKRPYVSYTLEADTAQIDVILFAAFGRSQLYDTVTVFSAEPGDFDHFDLTIDEGEDTANVSDGDMGQANWVRIEAQDANNIRLYTYNNTDTVTLTLNGSNADSSQITWFPYEPSPPTLGPPPRDTIVGVAASLPGGSFYSGVTSVGIANQIAETITMTATDTSGHTGTSPALTWLPIDVVGFTVAIEGGLTTITAIDDTVNMEVTAIDMFGNTTDVGLPRNVILSATRPVNFLSGETQLMESQVSLFPMVATQQTSDLVLRIADISTPAINGSSDPIIVNPSGIEEGPVVSSISASFGSGEISYAVATDGDISIKVYNKVGMEVGSLVDGAVSRGYYQASLKALNLTSDIYFVVMQGPGIDKKIKATLIK